MPSGEQAEREGSENQAPKEGSDRYRAPIHTAQAPVTVKGGPVVDTQQDTHWLLPPPASSQEQALCPHNVQTQPSLGSTVDWWKTGRKRVR